MDQTRKQVVLKAIQMVNEQINALQTELQASLTGGS